MSQEYQIPGDIAFSEINDSINHLKQAVIAGKPWYIALLESIGLWTWSEENDWSQKT